MKSPNLPKLVGKTRFYRDEIASLHNKFQGQASSHHRSPTNLSFRVTVIKRHRLARLLAKTVRKGKWDPQPAKLATVEIEGKERVLVRLSLIDRIVHGAVARMLTELHRPKLIRQVYSYQRGRAWSEAVSDFGRYLRVHRKKTQEVRKRGLYVIRCDIAEYTDTIPVHPRSELWRLLRESLKADLNDHEIEELVTDLLPKLVRPTTLSSNGGLFEPIGGIPTGSPMTAVLYNLYAQPIDQYLSSIPEAFYSRYSDDILFAHRCPDVSKQALEQTDCLLDTLGLALNVEKTRVYYFTGAGRRSEEWPEAQPTTHIDYLGSRLAFSGSHSLKRRKLRTLLRDLRDRARRVHASSEGLPLEERGYTLCRSLNQALNPRSPLAVKTATLLRRDINDREQLKQLDHHLYLIVAETLSGVQGPRAFRKCPPRRMREEWGLESLCVARNRQ